MQEIVNGYSFLMDDRDSLEKQLISFCDQWLWEGKKIKFKTSTMKEPVTGVINWASPSTYLRISIHVKNTKTRKNAKISPGDIVVD